MGDLNTKIYAKYIDLKKRKLLDEGLERKRERELKEVHDAMRELISDLQQKNEDLCKKLEDKQDELHKARMDFLEDIRAKDNEILRLKLLLAEKTDKNNSTAAGSQNRTPEPTLENPTPISPGKKTPQSNSKAKRVRLSETPNSKAKRVRLSETPIVPYSGSPEEEARELECSGRHTCTTGNGTNECPSAHMFHWLLESLVRMKISLNKETEGFSVSVSHEASGYSFTLTWLERPHGGGVWSYKLSSLGTLERVAVYWMKQDIRFSMNMCHRFFERISDIITKG